VLERIAAGALMPVLGDDTIAPRGDIYAVYPSKKYLSKKTQVLLRFLKAKFERLDEKA